jgi:hypothetical protein
MSIPAVTIGDGGNLQNVAPKGGVFVGAFYKRPIYPIAGK